MLNNDEGEMKAFFQLPDGTLKALFNLVVYRNMRLLMWDDST